MWPPTARGKVELPLCWRPMPVEVRFIERVVFGARSSDGIPESHKASAWSERMHFSGNHSSPPLI
jgi:hypothetical protein